MSPRTTQKATGCSRRRLSRGRDRRRNTPGPLDRVDFLLDTQDCLWSCQLQADREKGTGCRLGRALLRACPNGNADLEHSPNWGCAFGLLRPVVGISSLRQSVSQKMASRNSPAPVDRRKGCFHSWDWRAKAVRPAKGRPPEHRGSPEKDAFCRGTLLAWQCGISNAAAVLASGAFSSSGSTVASCLRFPAVVICY